MRTTHRRRQKRAREHEAAERDSSDPPMKGNRKLMRYRFDFITYNFTFNAKCKLLFVEGEKKVSSSFSTQMRFFPVLRYPRRERNRCTAFINHLMRRLFREQRLMITFRNNARFSEPGEKPSLPLDALRFHHFIHHNSCLHKGRQT